VAKQRQRARLYDGAYTRQELQKGDTHRRKRSAEMKLTGSFTPHGKGQTQARGRRLATARKQPHNLVDRVAAMFDRQQELVYDDLIWGPPKPKTYRKAPRVTKSTLRGLIKW
jgi:hypothetical protein